MIPVLAVLIVATTVSSASAAPLARGITGAGPSGPLRGTLLAPEGRGWPVVLILPGLQAIFSPQAQGFEISLFRVDPARLSAEVKRPYLILQGEADLQVSVDDARRLHAAAPQSTLVLLPGVNQVLKRVPADDRAANLAAYADPDRPIDPAVTDTVARFVIAHTPTRP